MRHYQNTLTGEVVSEDEYSYAAAQKGNWVLYPKGTSESPCSPVSEGYPEGWWHCTIHLNPETGEMHSDGDHRVRTWIQDKLANAPHKARAIASRPEYDCSASSIGRKDNG